MILEPTRICAPLFCKELSEEAGHSLTVPHAPLVVVLVSSGRVALVQEETALLAAGSVLVATGEIELSCAADSHLLWAGLCGSAAQEAAQRLQAPLVADAAACPLAGQALAELMAAYTRGAAQADLSAMCFALLCAVSQADSAVPPLPLLVAQAVLAMGENYAGLYGVEELSHQLGVSKSHLVRVFSAAMGTPPGQYLTRVRVAAAKRLLLNREYTLDVVASLCGFSGANYLCKVFKKETGLSPAAFRGQNTGSISRAQATEWEQALYI